MKTKFWNSDKILSISAILISISTLFTIVYQTNLMYKQQTASVLPYLEVSQSNPDMGTFKLIIVNNGVGPALVKKVKIIYGDTIHIGDPLSFYQLYIKPQDTINNFYYSSVNEGKLIPAGKTIEAISVIKSKENADKMRKWFASEEGATVEIEYTSVYDERWVSSNGNNGKPRKLE